ncbi:MAG: HIT domain-containing protein [bacterium]|nr:HIT domain-containing protein [bacterium]
MSDNRVETCVFCQIADGKIPATYLYQDEDIMIIENIHPVAKVHVLVIPKNHIVLNEIQDSEEFLGRLLLKAREAAEKKGIKESGYRIIVNTGKDAQADFEHLHLHVLGGEKLSDSL